MRAAARQSVVAGLDVAGHLPPGLREAAAAAARQSFIDGLWAGSLVAAGATAVAALATLAFLPARVQPPGAGTPRPPRPSGPPRPTGRHRRRAAERAAAQPDRPDVPR